MRIIFIAIILHIPSFAASQEGEGVYNTFPVPGWIYPELRLSDEMQDLLREFTEKVNGVQNSRSPRGVAPP